MGSAQRTVSPASHARAEQARPHLFRGKVQRPEPAPALLTRPRLHALLDDGVARGVVLVSAPAATGKTWAVSDWAGQEEHRGEVAWLTLDAADRAPGRFLRYVLAALDRTAAGHEALAGLAPLPPFSAPDERYLADVADALTRLSRRVVLVLDEFEHVVGSETETLVRRILRYPPEQARVVVVSRVEPDIGQARLRLDGRLVEIRSPALALTAEETRALMDSHDVPVDEREALQIHDKTHGWVAAVTLAISSLAQAPDTSAAITALPAREPALRSLLSEVYDEQRPALQRIMRRACVADLLCGSLVDALSGGSGGHLALQELERANLVAPVAHGDGEWYRWEPMLAALLRGRLHVSDPDLERDLHRTAARWFRQDGQPVPAVEHALAGGDAKDAAAVLATCWLDLVVDGESALLTRLLGLCGDEVVTTHPELAVAGAFMGVRADDVEASLALVRTAVARGAGLGGLPRRNVETMATVVRLYAATMTGRPCEDDADVTARTLLERTSGSRTGWSRGERIRRALLLFNLGAFETSRQRYDAGRSHLSAASEEAERLGMPYLWLSCGAQLVEHDLRDGSLAQGRTRAREVLDAARNRGWHSYHGLTAAHVNLAAIAVFEDDLDAALDHLAEAERVARPVDHLGSFRAQVLRVVALCAAGRVTEAKDGLDLLHARIDGTDPPAWVGVTLAMADAMRDSCDGQPDAGLRRLDAVDARACGPETLDDLQLLHARLLLDAGRPTDARAELAAVLARGPRRPARVSASVLDALATEMLGRHEEALDLLDDALGATCHERLVRPFVAPGTPARQLLEQLVERGTAHEDLALQLLEHTSAGPQREPASSGLSPFYVEPLSDREREVLRHMQGTRTNTEMAADLYVSVNTLRTHMKSINRKLGAADRRDAVRRARDLGLL